MNFINIVLVIISVVFFIMMIGNISNYLVQTKKYKELFNSYGKKSKKEYSYEEYESISHFFKNTLDEDQCTIDDITWNDLEMDQIFSLLNHTYSSMGRDYLYKLLRTPCYEPLELQERERLIEYFDQNPEQRTKLIKLFSEIGYTKKIAISDYMKSLSELKKGSNVFHWLLNILLIGSIGYMLIVDPVQGVGLVILSSALSIVNYYKYKSKIESYFISIRQLVTMTHVAKKIVLLNLPELEVYNLKLKKIVVDFRKITRNSFLLVGKNQVSGSILDVIMEYVRMFTHIDLIKFNHMLKDIHKNNAYIFELMSTLGYLETMISIASYRNGMPYYSVPKFNPKKILSIEDLYHISIKEPISNSFTTTQSILLTGSNASGKSTFLKATAICALLAQTIHTCPSKSYNGDFYRIYSSMALRDNLESGDSYYIVEIKSLKRIIDVTKQSGPQILCFIDEVLRGTNTIERIAASSEILTDLANTGTLCFAATHDIELTYILENIYSNYHFTENIINSEIIFSYVLFEGRANSRNAIKLLDVIGYDQDMIVNAEQRANQFIKTGKW